MLTKHRLLYVIEQRYASDLLLIEMESKFKHVVKLSDIL